MITEKVPIQSVDDGKYIVSFSSFTENEGINISISPSQDPSTSLYISNSFFHRCSKQKGGAIYFFTSNTKDHDVIILKTCGAHCYLVGNDCYGIFYYLRGNQTIDMTSYIGDKLEGVRDTINHEVGNHMITNINISSNHVPTRSFGYCHPQSSTTTVKYSTSHNNSATVDAILWIRHENTISANFISVSFVECSLSANSINLYLILTNNVTTFIESSFVRCASNQYFSDNFVFVHCYFDNINTESLNLDLEMPYTEMQIIFLNTFLCDSKYTEKVHHTCKKNSFNSGLFLTNLYCTIILSSKGL